MNAHSMKQAPDLNSFIGNRRAVEILRRAIEKDRLPHAMIFSGPPGVGKCTLALLVAQILNCQSPVNQGACGQCSSCGKILATLESRNLPCETKDSEGFCGNCPNCRLRMRRHPDIRLIEPIKTTIAIDQVRELIDEIAFQPFEARYRFAILDPADRMKIEAQNSLLKTLEEPSSRTHIILITTNPYLLLETIRSRARLLEFGEIPQDAIERHLTTRGTMSGEDARLAAALSGGSLAAAMEFDTAAYREIRDQALRFVALLLKGGDFKDASDMATQTSKDKKSFALWIEAVTALVEDTYYAAVSPDRIGQVDLRKKLDEMARTVSRSALVSVIKAVGKLKKDLQINVNRQLALEAMFLELNRH
jgi:DNA polymerase-3 subunit delta'